MIKCSAYVFCFLIFLFFFFISSLSCIRHGHPVHLLLLLPLPPSSSFFLPLPPSSSLFLFGRCKVPGSWVLISARFSRSLPVGLGSRTESILLPPARVCVSVCLCNCKCVSNTHTHTHTPTLPIRWPIRTLTTI